jgi:hypothetical protein
VYVSKVDSTVLGGLKTVGAAFEADAAKGYQPSPS